MKIIILGSGQVGASLATSLASEANDITVVDTDTVALHDLQDSLDLRTVAGPAAHPGVLRRAGGNDADMLIAVTNSDETNMIACQVAHILFRTPMKIARVREHGYLAYPELFSPETIAVDVLISPEQLVTEYIHRLIEYPGALQVLNFADGKVQLVAVKAYQGSPLVGKELQTIREHMPGVDSRVAAIYRRNHPIIPTGSTVIEADDEVFFIAAKKHIRAVMGELRRQEKPARNVIIAGGGNIGTRLAAVLENEYRVKLIEKNPERARSASENLASTIVLQGNAADAELLLTENIEETDIFCALTNDDEANILASMLAKRLGVHKVMTLINRSAYVDLVDSSEIDVAISPQQITIGTLLTHVRRGDVVAVHSLRRGAAEAIEAIAHGDRHSSRVVGRSIHEIRLPHGTTIGAIVRAQEALIAHHDMVIEAGDHVILFVVDKRRIPEVERLFQVGITFL